MDYKQKQILKNIYEMFNIHSDKKITFIQHRNLKEFKFFTIERINPNHRIKLYGKLKKKYIHDNNHNKFINVGEIIICTGLLLFPYTIIMVNILVSIALYMYLLNLIQTKNFKIRELLYVNWYRGFTKFWKNNTCSTLY